MPADQPTAPEIWKPIPSTNGLYEASSVGRVRRSALVVLAHGVVVGEFSPYVLKSRVSGRNPYPGVAVRAKLGQVCGGQRSSGGDKQYSRSVHVLVAEAFLGPRPHRMDVNHKNGQHCDNRVENLEYISRSANILDTYRRGRICTLVHKSGEDHHSAKLTDRQVSELRAFHASLSGGPWGSITHEMKKKAEELGVSLSLLNSIVSGRSRQVPVAAQVRAVK